MIDPKELRIGNLISIKYIGEEPLINDQHSYQEINVHNLYSLVYKETDYEILPIPLTPEILEKCGFVKSKRLQGGFTIDGLEIDLDYITQDQEGYEFEYKFGLSDKWNIVHVRYLHQLQNIIYALTGEELNITL